MKIFVISKKNFLYWDHHVVDAFKELEHTIMHFQYYYDKVSHNGFKRVINEHTYVHRMKKVLEHV